MKLSHFILSACITLALCLGYTNVVAQPTEPPSTTIGLRGRYTLERSSLLLENSGQELAGQGNEWSFGADISIPILFGGRLRIGTGLNYTAKSQKLTFAQPGYVIRPFGESSWYLSTSDEFAFNSSRLEFDMTAQWELAEDVFLRAGPTVGYRFVPTYQLPNDAVLRPTGTEINDGRVAFHFTPQGTTAIISYPTAEEKEIAIPSEELVFSSSETDGTLAVGSIVGLSWRLDIGRNFLIIPELTFQSSTAPVFPNSSGTGIQAGFGISLASKIPWNRDDAPIDTTTSLSDESLSVLPDRKDPAFPVQISVQGTNAAGQPQAHIDVNIFETAQWDDRSEAWDISRQIEQPSLLITPSYPKDARRWEILFRFGDSVIAHGSSADRNPLATIDWSITPQADSSSMLDIEFSVESALGTATTVGTKVPVYLNRMVRIIEQRTDGTIYTLYPFDQDSTTISAKNREVLAEILEELKPDSHITITGFVEDRKETVPALDLSVKRTRQVMLELQRMCRDRGYEDLIFTASPSELYPGEHRKSLPPALHLAPHVSVLIADGNP